TYRREARNTAAESMVLLKNSSGLLPIKKSGTIAVIGPLANSKENMLGTWAVSADYSTPVSLLTGLQQVAGSDAKILYAKGSNLSEDSLFEQRVSVFGKPLEMDRRPEEEILNEALAIAQQSDIIIAALGEAAEMSGESSSRTNLDLPQSQKRLLEALLKTGKPVVLVLFTGRPLTLTWENKNVPAILNAWHGGTETGNAVADVLFGTVNPSGKLSSTWPQNVGQIPLYYNHKNTGRPLPEGKWFQKFTSNYLDVTNEPLFPFGFGLSYTRFQYSDIVLNQSAVSRSEKLTATITITNIGDHDGKEVVQLYLNDPVASITQPVKKLIGFQKIFLKKGESREIQFVLTVADLKFYNSDLKYEAEAGDFNLYIGTNSKDVKSASFVLKK
ncbi:MAG: glycoside hydrolase family 3 C-terminal domain-containing protein, partial [Flavisolibacter sp.]|nr:glycoside hydrolase family 3 C-terminal domain-containing protein [Flavisolibacter sp.]